MAKFIDSCKIQTKCLPIKFRQQSEISPEGIYSLAGRLATCFVMFLEIKDITEIYNKTKGLFPFSNCCFSFYFLVELNLLSFPSTRPSQLIRHWTPWFSPDSLFLESLLGSDVDWSSHIISLQRSQKHFEFKEQIWQ